MSSLAANANWSLKKRYVLLIFAILLLSIGQITSDIYLPSLPAIARYFDTTTVAVQLTITLYFIGYGVSQFIYGPLSDYFGRRPIVLISLCVYLFGTASCFYASSVEFLLISRIIQGIGMGGIATTASALPQDLFSGKKIGEAYSYIGFALAITPLLAPIAGGYFQHYFGWHANFFFLFSYALACALILVFYFPETNPNTHENELSVRTVIKNYLHILKNFQFVVSLSALVLTLLGELLYIVWMPILLQNYFHLTPIGNGWMMIFPAIALACGSFASTFICRLANRQVAIIAGITMILISACLLLFSSVIYFTPFAMIAAMSFYMLGSGMTFSLYISICTGCYPEKAGTAAALMSGVLTSMAGLSGAVLLTQMAAEFQLLPFTLLGISALLGVVVYFQSRDYFAKQAG